MVRVRVWQIPRSYGYQGVVAFYYDQLRPNTAVKLNVCGWNQVAADVI
jgi:hypothetical protein